MNNMAKQEIPTSTGSRAGRVKEQKLLFSEDHFYPSDLPTAHELKPSLNLSAIFDDCHNHIYANEGFLKDKIFHEMVKLIVMKLHDEQTPKDNADFGVTATEYQDVLADRPDTFQPRMDALYAVVKSKHPTLLTDDKLKLQTRTLAFLAGRMQFVSLTQTPGDVKGEAFQAFTYRHQRGGRGEFFTPHPIVRLAVEMLSPLPHEKVLDPACGSGGFLIQTISYLQDNYPDADTAEYVRSKIRGIEFNPDVALSASIRIAFEGGIGAEISCSNALMETPSILESFDVILANPPFGSKGKVEDRNILKSYVLARKWNRSASGVRAPTNTLLPGQSPDVLFIEKCLKLLRPGGRMAIVLPDGLLQNISNSHIRLWMRSQAQVLGVVSIPQEAFIPYGTGIKTSLLLLQKMPASDQSACFMARMEKMGYDVKGQVIYRRDAHGTTIRTPQGTPDVDDDVEEIADAYRCFTQGDFCANNKIYQTPKQSLDSRLDVEYYLPDDQSMLRFLKEQGAKPLAQVGDILNETDTFRTVTNTTIRYVAISDVDYRTMQVVSQQEIKSHDAPSRASFRVCKGDIITAISGASTGTAKQATALITEDEEDAICSNGFAVIRGVHGVDPLFLLAFMRTEYFLRQVRRMMTGHAIPAISQEDLARVLVPIPPIEQQERVSRSVAAVQAMRREALKAGEKLSKETATIIGCIK